MFLRILIGLLRFRGKMRKEKNLHYDQIRSILIVELTRMGDVIAMLPSINLLSKYFPSAKVHLLINDQYKLFLQSIGLSCEVHGILRPESAPGFLRSVAFVRRLRVDLALSMSPPKRNAAVTLMSGAERKVGYLTYVDSLTPYLKSTRIEGFGCSISEPGSYARENIQERSRKVCNALGISSKAVRPEIQLRRELVHEVQQKLVASKTIPDRQFIVIHPFSGWEFRSWELDRFNQVAERVLSSLNYDVVFLCEKKEEEKLSSSRREFQGRSNVYFFASNDLFETTVVLKHASLLLCNDSGPLHLAAALGVRVIGLFGPASPELTAPQGADGGFLYKQVECSPCDQYKCVRPTNTCMNLISTEAVFQAVMKQLSTVSVRESVANA